MEEENQCPVCQSATPPGATSEEALVALPCGHSLHMRCMLTWNRTQVLRYSATTCPTCRYEVVPAASEREEVIAVLDGVLRIEAAVDDDDLEEDAVQRLHMAIEMGDRTDVRETIRTYSRPRVLVNLRGDFGMNALHRACIHGDIGIVEDVLWAGARSDSENDCGMTPLHVCCFYGSHAAAAFLVDIGRSPVSARDLKGLTPLHVAVERKDVNIVQLLLDRGADVNAQDRYGRTPIHYAARAFCGETILAMLFRRSPSLDTIDFMGSTPLHVAVHRGNVNFAKKYMSVAPSFYRLMSDYNGDSAEELARSSDNAPMIAVFVDADQIDDEPR